MNRIEIDTVLQDIGREFALLTALIAVTGSLFTSTILGWSPCQLCAYQRVFMYPLVLVLGAALVSNHRHLADAALALAVLGAPVSLFHHLFIRFDPTQGCGFALPCSMQHQLNIGGAAFRPMYLPLLSFIAFTLIAVALWRYRKQ